MPANDGIRPNDGERLAGLRKQLADPTQNHSVGDQKWHPPGPASSQHDDLLPQHENRGFHAARGTIPKITLQRSNIPQSIIRFCVSRQLNGFYDRDRTLCVLVFAVTKGI